MGSIVKNCIENKLWDVLYFLFETQSMTVAIQNILFF